MARLSESDLENHALDVLRDLGHSSLHGSTLDPETSPERSSYHGTLLEARFLAALRRLNPNAPDDALHSVLYTLRDNSLPELIQENRRVHRLLVDGVPVAYPLNGETFHDRLRLVDWSNTENDWLAVNQFSVVGTSSRRPDIVLFLNGLPVVVIELKAPESTQADVRSAFHQIQTYKTEIPALFYTNLLCVISDGFAARFGTLSADFDRFMTWRTEDGENLVDSRSALAVDTLLRGLLRPEILTEMLRAFLVFENDGRNVVKKAAGYHQFHAARKGLSKIKSAIRTDGKAGVVWHTQGSGKSLLMAFLAGVLTKEPELGNPTILILTDRNDLDHQLFDTFSRCMELFGQEPEQVDSVQDLRKRLDRQVGGIVFATIQKFRSEDGAFPVITARKNVIVFVDEAHRSQYGFGAKIDTDSGKKSYGFAFYVRQGLPNATFVGFTGTPIELVDKNTTNVFGDYIDVYDITQAVEDGATVPIYYEGKIVRLKLDDETSAAIDTVFEEVTEGLEDSEKAELGGKWSTLETLAGSDTRLEDLAQLVVDHFEQRQTAMLGKGMLVCMSRRICVEMYDRIMRLRPDWAAANDQEGRLKVVMTGSASDPAPYQPHIRGKPGLDLLARRFRDAADPFELVIVRDMWLTGFDSPSMHTLYVDKPMQGHNLMQAIARVNRIFKNKPAGLVVDTIGIATDLKKALTFYSDKDRGNTGIDTREAINALRQALEVLQAMFHGFDYRPALTGAPKDRLRTVAAAVDHILKLEGNTEEAVKAGRKRFMDAVATFEKAFKLTSGTAAGLEATDEFAFFTAVRVAIRKMDAGEEGERRGADLDAAIKRLVNQAVASTEIVDLLAAAGIQSPDISILSDEFLHEMEGIPQRNLAIEALKKLLSGEIKQRTRTNLVRNRQFSERLASAMANYHNRVVDALQVIEELIRIAQDLREEPEDGLTAEEVALYEALADNPSAMEVMGNEKLRVIAQRLVTAVRENGGVDWWQISQRRKDMRRAVKRILRETGYPPDLQDQAIQTVVRQAEALAAEITLRERERAMGSS
jgi:type I restriction enzyme, R subunit